MLPGWRMLDRRDDGDYECALSGALFPLSRAEDPEPRRKRPDLGEEVGAAVALKPGAQSNDGSAARDA